MNLHDIPVETLPWSPEAEHSVIGGLLLDNGSWDRVGDLLESKHFFDERHGRIFVAIGSLIAACKLADVLAVHEQLQNSGNADGIDMMQINDLSQCVTGTANIRRHAEIIVGKALMRGLMEAADDVKLIAVTAGVPVAERLDQAQSRLQALQIHRSRRMPVGISECVVSLLDRVQDLADGKTDPGIPTGIPGLDRMLGGGFKGGKQIIVAARPSVGKSSLGGQLCISLARSGYPAAMFSQEMDRSELTDRATANIGRIALDRLLTGRLDDAEWGRLTDAVEQMRSLPLFFDDQPALSLMDISAKARMLKRQHDIKLIVIDYLQLCASGKPGDSRHHQIEEISRGLKTLARQLNITIVTLSQLNREVEKRASGRPVMSDLKESGAIEEDADVVILLSRHNIRPDGTQIIACDIPKNRQGRVGSIALGFEGGYQSWHETAESLTPKQPARRHYTEEA